MTMTKDDYLARVPDLQERENAARLFEAMKAAEKALAEATEPPETPAQTEAIAVLLGERSKKRREVEDWFDVEFAKIRGPDPLDDLERADREAAAAYSEAPGDAIEEDSDGAALRCALSGAPIYETDETVDLGGKPILACVLLTPEQIEALTAEDDSDDEIEEAA